MILIRRAFRNSNDSQTILRLLRYLLHFKNKIVLLCLCFIVSTSLAFVQPLIIRAITDQGMGEKNFSYIIFFSAALFASVLVWQSIDVLQTKILVHVHNESSLLLYVQALEKLLKMPITYFQNRNPAEIVNRVTTDIGTAASITDQGLMYSIINIFRVFSGLIGLVVVNWKLSLLILVMIPIKYLIIVRLSVIKGKRIRRMIEISRTFSDWLGDIIGGAKEIKLWNLMPLKMQDFIHKRKEIMNNYRDNAMLDRYNLFLEVILDTFTTCAIYVFAGYLICVNSFTIGGAFAFIAYSSSVMGPLSIVLNIKYNMMRITPSAARLFEFFDMEEEGLGDKDASRALKDKSETKFQTELEPKDKPQSEAFIVFNKIRFAYGDETLLQEVNLTIRKGEKIGIVGENGSGKSTLINLLLGFYKPTSGTIKIADTNIVNLGLAKLRDYFAIVSQESYLFQDSVEGNVDLRGDAGEDEIRAACHRSGAEEFINLLPQTYAHKIGINGASLSAGERQKLILARALLKSAEIIILDEATSNCDVNSEAAFYDMIDSHLKDKTVILITHKYNYLNRLDRVFELNAGKLRQIEPETLISFV